MREEFKGVNVLPLMAEEAIRAVRREKVDYNSVLLRNTQFSTEIIIN